MKYKVGDKVIIRKDLIDGYLYDGETWVYLMDGFKGKELTIKSIELDEWATIREGYGIYFYTMEEDTDNYEWAFTDAMIEE